MLISVSSSSISASGLINIHRLARENHFPGLELNFVAGYRQDQLEFLINNRSSLPVSLHNYFPPPEKPFVLNLASMDESIRTMSLEHCRQAIDLSTQLGAGYYSAHAGFAFDLPPTHLGRPDLQAALPKKLFTDLSSCHEMLVQSARTLTDYGRPRGVRFLIENNVSAPAVGQTGKELLPGLRAEDLVQLVRDVDDDNFGLLIDAGHLNVTANALDFDRHRFLDLVGPYMSAWHLSHNDGLTDQHQPLTADDWFLPRLKEINVLGLTLEFSRASMDSIFGSLDIVERYL